MILVHFQRNNSRDSRINNFILLEPILRSLQIKFNAKQINDIIKEKRGSSLQLLCQLKMKLEKVTVPLDHKMSDTKPAKKLNPGKEKYDGQANTHFKVQLQELNESQKNVNLRNHLQKFEEIKQKQEAQAHREDQREIEMNIKLKQDMRNSGIDKLQRNAGFMEEWLRKGIEDWKKNQTSKKDREKKQLQFELTLTEKIANQTTTHIDKAKTEVILGIDEFENNLKRNGIDTEAHGSKESSPSKTRLTINKSSNLFGRTNQTMTGTLGNLSIGGKAKERGSRMSEATRKERERRRGKLTKALNNDILRDMENNTREEQYIERLKRQSKQEDELNYEIWKTEQNKNVIIENRKLREARYYKRKELDTTNAISREEEMLRTLDEQRNIDEESHYERETDLKINTKQDQRKYRTEMCAQMLEEIFEIANQAYILQQQTDSEEIDERNWREWTKLFKQQESIKVAYVEGKPDFDEDDDKVVGETQVDTEEESLQKADFTLDDEELTDYLKSQGQWKEGLVNDENNKINLEEILNAGEAAGGKGGKGGQAESKLEEDEQTIPDQLPKNNILGDVVEQIIYINYDGDKEIVKPEVPDHLPLRLAMVGKSFAGKKTQAQLIAEKYNLKQYHPFELIEEALGRSKEELEKIDEEHVEKDSQPKDPEEKEEIKEGENQPEEEKAENEGEGKEDETPEPPAEDQKEKQEEAPKEDAPKEDAPKEDAPKEDAPKEDVPKEDAPKEEPQPEDPTAQPQEEAKAAEPQEEPTAQPDDATKTKEIVVGEEQESINVFKKGSQEEVLDVEAEFERNGSHDNDHPMPKEEK